MKNRTGRGGRPVFIVGAGKRGDARATGEVGNQNTAVRLSASFAAVLSRTALTIEDAAVARNMTEIIPASRVKIRYIIVVILLLACRLRVDVTLVT